MEGIRQGLRGTLALICIASIHSCGYEPLDLPSISVEQQPLETQPRACAQENPFGEAVGKASIASRLAQTARSQAEWQTVVLHWMQAIERMQAVKGDDPKWAFAQKKVAEYQNYLTVAKQQTNRLPRLLPFTSFKSQIFDEKLWLFLSYRAALQTPDILIVGSSRALQGVDPLALEKNLIPRGHAGIKAFNLGINGSTAQVVDVLLREILTPEQLPDLIIWADGVRAFNSGREDLTYGAIASSSGYRELVGGKRPELPAAASASNSQNCSQLQGILPSIEKFGGWLGRELPAIAAGVGAIDANGFLAISQRFDRDRYYQQFPDVPGLYDADYQNFTLAGEQTEALNRLQNYLQQRQIPLVFVNLPVTGDYLDETRQGREEQFRTFMTEESQKQGFAFIDLGEQWRERPEYFADPSHLNRYGAVLIGEQLANNPKLPYTQVKNPDTVQPAIETKPSPPEEPQTIILPTPPLN